MHGITIKTTALYLLVTLCLYAIPVAVFNLVSKRSFPTADFSVIASFHELDLASSSEKRTGKLLMV
jgi:hypothetical protein